MAYFSKLNSLLQPQNNRPSDLLLPQNQQQQQEDQQQNTGLQRATNIAAPGNKAEAGQTESEYTKLNSNNKGSAAKEIFDANQNVGAADASSYGGNLIAEQQKALQNEADKYKTTTAYKPALNNDDYSKAANGDEEAFNRVDSVLNQKQADPQAFSYAGEKDAVAENYIKTLNNQNILQSILKNQNQGASDYSENAAAIDAVLLSSSDGFKKQRNQMISDYATYEKQKADAAARASGQADSFIKQREAEKEAVRKQLLEMSQGIESGLGTKFEAAKAAKVAELEKQRQVLVAKQEAIKNEYLAKLNAEAGVHIDEDAYQAAMNRNSFGLSEPASYISGGNKQLSLENVTSAEEAKRFQKISQLLNSSKLLKSEAAGSDDLQLDEAGLRANLDAQLQSRKVEIDKLKAIAEWKEADKKNIAPGVAQVSKISSQVDKTQKGNAETAKNFGKSIVDTQKNNWNTVKNTANDVGNATSKGFKKVKSLFK